jgi:H+/Cl- antiporter ClcA
MAGYLMRFYKVLYYHFADYFKSSSWGLKLFVVFLLAGFLYFPEFRKYQSLGLAQFTDLISLQASFVSAASKLFLTLLSTTVGFLGGEFIPLVFAGVHLGGSLFSLFSLNPYLGGVLGAYLLFAAGTRLKWSSYVLILGLLGFGWLFWAWYVVMISVSFSGDLSLYKHHL